jgi:hypothetical protein
MMTSFPWQFFSHLRFFGQPTPITPQAPKTPAPSPTQRTASHYRCINKANAFTKTQLMELRAHGFNI